MTNAHKTVEHLLSLADIRINGSRPFDIQIHDDRFYNKVLAKNTLGLGEAYMDGWWDAQQLDVFFQKVFEADLRSRVGITPNIVRSTLVATIVNQQVSRKAHANAAYHYNIGNDLYAAMLDKRMVYSCGYWKGAKSLDKAQENKLELICQKLSLKKGMTLLDIGCGWGGFAEYAASKYGVVVTGITPAAEQVKLAKKRTRGLPVTVLQQDYRQLQGSYDRIVSIGMLEHVGPKNYGRFFKICQDRLNDGGLMLHHTIGNNGSTKVVDPWMDKYIFPGGVIPSLSQISDGIERRLVVEDLHNFGPDYDKTLMAWRDNFASQYPGLKDVYDERFYRMWVYYLVSCAAAFRTRNIQLWQLVMRKVETSPTYYAPR